MRWFKQLATVAKGRLRTKVCDALLVCRPLTFVRRCGEVLPCDLENVDFLQSPVDCYCIEMHDGWPIFTIGYTNVYAIVCREVYPTQWEYIVLYESRHGGLRYKACDEIHYRRFRILVKQAHVEFVKRLNKEFQILIPMPWRGVDVPSMTGRDTRLQFNHQQIITPYTKANEPSKSLQQYEHLTTPWVRGVWLPTERYGTDRNGVWIANWDWRVADDDRVYALKQRKPLPASYK